MVIVKKLIILSSILIICSATNAQGSYLKQAKVYFNNKEYSKSRETILKNRDIFKKTPTRELLLIALSFEKEGNYKNILYYELILKYHHNKENNTLMKDYKESGVDELSIEVSKRLTFIYLYMGKSLYELAYQSYIGNDNASFQKHIKKSTMYLELASEGTGKYSEKADEYLSKVEEIKSKLTAQVFKTHYGLSLTSMYWTDDLRVKASGNVSKKSQASSSAMRIGGEYQLKREDSTIHISAGFFFGNSNIGNLNEVGFYQSDLANYGFDITPAIHFFSPYKEASFGIGLPLIYRVISFETPGEVEVEGLSQFSQGLEIQSMWYLEHFYFNVNFGKISNFEGLHLGLRVGYLF